MRTKSPAQYSAIDLAKKSIAPQADLKDWLLPSDSSAAAASDSASSDDSSLQVHDDTVSFDKGGLAHPLVYRDNVTRIPGPSFAHDVHGDSLPHVPAVLTGLLDVDDWLAHHAVLRPFSTPAAAAAGTDADTGSMDTAFQTARVSLDGGPSFARMSMGQGKVTLEDYQHYCESGEASKDLAPLYVFDPNLLEVPQTHVPACFSNDVMACIDGTEYRPLPPAWLLVGVKRSGTPIHDHPLTVAWNALLAGCKLWCCLPPNVDERLLLLNLNEEEEDAEFDLSALEWFRQSCGTLPESAKIIVQRPGEVVYLPAGWFHVVLNVETSTAISVSLALRRDLPVVLPRLMESDEDFATFWMDRLRSTMKLHADGDGDGGAYVEETLAQAMQCCKDSDKYTEDEEHSEELN